MMNKWKLVVLIIAVVLATGSQAKADEVVLTFEGLGNQVPIGNFYNGGGGGSLGITFGADSLAIISRDAGGSGNFSNNPSGDTIAFFLSGPGDVMDVPAGFSTGFSFFYSSSTAGSVSVYSGLDGTGTLLETLNLTGPCHGHFIFIAQLIQDVGNNCNPIFVTTGHCHHGPIRAEHQAQWAECFKNDVEVRPQLGCVPRVPVGLCDHP